jgi:hypothetical protein
LAYATVDDLAGALHVRVTAENQIALQRAVDAASVEVDHDVDRRRRPVARPAAGGDRRGNAGLAVEAYKMPDAAFGSSGLTTRARTRG